MAFHIRNAETEALARQLATLKNAGLTEVVHDALRRELERELGKPSLVEQVLAFTRALRAKGRPERGLPADKAFIDGLYEGD